MTRKLLSVTTSISSHRPISKILFLYSKCEVCECLFSVSIVYFEMCCGVSNSMQVNANQFLNDK